MIVKYDASISYNIDSNHPDIDCVSNWTPERVFRYSDTYSFNTDLFGSDVSEMKEYIKNDLAYVAGGGYDTEHISNVKYEIKRKCG